MKYVRLYESTLGEVVVMEHVIYFTEGAASVRKFPSRTRPGYIDVVKEQVQKMMEIKVIEPEIKLWA